jgi:hypothetical protein
MFPVYMQKGVLSAPPSFQVIDHSADAEVDDGGANGERDHAQHRACKNPNSNGAAYAQGKLKTCAGNEGHQQERAEFDAAPGYGRSEKSGCLLARTTRDRLETFQGRCQASTARIGASRNRQQEQGNREGSGRKKRGKRADPGRDHYGNRTYREHAPSHHHRAHPGKTFFDSFGVDRADAQCGCRDCPSGTVRSLKVSGLMSKGDMSEDPGIAIASQVHTFEHLGG